MQEHFHKFHQCLCMATCPAPVMGKFQFTKIFKKQQFTLFSSPAVTNQQASVSNRIRGAKTIKKENVNAAANDMSTEQKMSF